MSRAGEIQVHCEVIQHAEDSSANVLLLNVSVVDGGFWFLLSKSRGQKYLS